MGKHEYYRLEFTLTSPMCISSGASLDTDRAVLRDRQGRPFIPATTIAGVMRSLLSEQDGDRLFGSVADQGQQSPVIVYDACLRNGADIIRRDHVALDGYRVALDQRKYNAEYVDAGAVFIGYLETDAHTTDDVTGSLEKLLARFKRGGCAMGSKTTKGSGQAALSVKKKSFDFSKDDEKKNWLEFDLFDEKAFEGCAELDLPAEADQDEPLRVVVEFEMKGGLSIREYRTEASDGNELSMPDSMPVRSAGKAVIPGTAWAGAFRHRFEQLLKDSGSSEEDRDKLQKELFGTTEHVSLVRFSETQIEGGEGIIYSRNAIDRFSGKVKDTALYTEEFWYGGSGKLRISVAGEAEAWSKKVLGACLADLIHGYLAVGGLGATGRGLINATALSVDGKDIDLNSEGWEGSLINAMAGCVNG